MPSVESSCPSAICLTVSQEEVCRNALSDVACMEHVLDAMGAAPWSMYSAVILQETRGDLKVLFPLSLFHQASCLHWRTDWIKQGNGWIINQADWTTTCGYQMHQNSRVNCDATRFSYSKLGGCSKGWKGCPVIGRMLVWNPGSSYPKLLWQVL